MMLKDLKPLIPELTETRMKLRSADGQNNAPGIRSGHRTGF